MNVNFAKISLAASTPLVVIAAQGSALSPSAKRIDTATKGALAKAIANSKFDGKTGQVLTVMAPAGAAASRIVVIGVGDIKKVDALAAAKLGGRVVAQLAMSGQSKVAIAADLPAGSKLDAAMAAAQIGYGARLRSYRFDKYRTTQKKDEKPSLTRLTVMCADPTKARAAHKPLAALADGVFLTRDLVSEPANILHPISYAKEIRKLTKDGLKVEVLGQARLEKLGMGSLVGVAEGSQHDAQVVIMRWDGAPKRAEQKPIAFVGKGVTFDTGGISIKPSAGMGDMKWDMGGSGVVVGLMRALALRKAKVNVVGVVGLVENMPSGTAQRPGDVVTSMSGQTIEVLNTDAEGRLVLADALWYTQKRFKPRFMIDLATLTGAIIVSLGNYQAGLFSNDDTLTKQLVDAGKAVTEPVWPMPMDDAYDKLIRSDIADMKNIGGRGGGSVTAAKFLERFVNKVPWVHLDIAGVTWSSEATDLVPRGGTAFGVRLLNKLVEDHYEAD
ncbi:MAG: leucyl aminopeptidase [Alphaproteobacteria bacterium]